MLLTCLILLDYFIYLLMVPAEKHNGSLRAITRPMLGSKRREAIVTVDF